MIKLMMPDAKGEFSDGFRQAVVETELHQKLCASDFIASVFAWGTFDGGAHRNMDRLCLILTVVSTAVYRRFPMGYDGVLRARNSDGSFTRHHHYSARSQAAMDPRARSRSPAHTQSQSYPSRHQTGELLSPSRQQFTCRGRSYTSPRTQDNILIGTARGEKIAKYIDFGLAIEVTPGVSARYGRAGTPGYMSPEVNQKFLYLYAEQQHYNNPNVSRTQVNARLPYSPWADVWSLGVVFFQVCGLSNRPAAPPERISDLVLHR